MSTLLHRIVSRSKPFPIAIVQPEHFTLGEGVGFDPAIVVDDPCFSLYCFDFARGSALFVWLPPGSRPERAPFYYVPQFDEAVDVVSMPLETFHRVAATIPTCPTTIVHSVGRCGSTLLSKALASVPSVHSLSEPDDWTQLVIQDGDRSRSDAELAPLVASSLAWRRKPRHGPAFAHLAIKTRSEVLRIGKVLCRVASKAKHVYLYRDALSWAGSVNRTWRGDASPDDTETRREVQAAWGRFSPLVRELASEEHPLHPLVVRTLTWAQNVEDYLDLVEAGVPFVAASYEQLSRDPVSVLQAVFRHCGIDGVDWGAVGDSLSRDSQQGSFYDRATLSEERRALPPGMEDEIRSVLAERPRVQRPDIRLPHTVELS